MITIGRHIEGITINPLEYVLDDNGEVMEFDSEDEAKAWLRKMGVSEEEIYWMVFEETVPVNGGSCH